MVERKEGRRLRLERGVKRERIGRRFIKGRERTGREGGQKEGKGEEEG